MDAVGSCYPEGSWHINLFTVLSTLVIFFSGRWCSLFLPYAYKHTFKNKLFLLFFKSYILCINVISPWSVHYNKTITLFPTTNTDLYEVMNYILSSLLTELVQKQTLLWLNAYKSPFFVVAREHVILQGYPLLSPPSPSLSLSKQQTIILLVKRQLLNVDSEATPYLFNNNSMHTLQKWRLMITL